MKTERFLGLQTGNQPTTLLHYQAWAIAKILHWAVPRTFPKPVDWNRIQTCTEKSDETVHDCCNWLQITFKENSGFLQMLIPPRWVLTLLMGWTSTFQVKEARMKCQIMSTLTRFNQSSKLTLLISRWVTSKGRLPKFLIFNSSNWRSLNRAKPS